MKIVIDRDIPYIRGVFEALGAEVAYLPGSAIGPDDVRDAGALIIRTRTRADARLLEGSRVRVVATATIGFDHIDTDYCRTRGIEVATSAGCNARAVAQWVFAALGALYGAEAAGRTLGVIGVGNVGSVVRAVALGAGFREVLCCDPPREASQTAGLSDTGTVAGFPERESVRPRHCWEKNGEATPGDATCRGGGRPAFPGANSAAKSPSGREIAALPSPATHIQFISQDELLARADIVTLHVPLDSTTRGMAGDAFFARMKPGALLLNSSRGEVIDDEALKAVLREGRIMAGLDVWNGEPAIDRGLLALARLATPHIAGYSQQGKAMGTAMAVRAVAATFGLPLPQDWYPAEAPPGHPRTDLPWSEIVSRLPEYYHILCDDRALRAAPDAFERLRNGYAYRPEFF